MNSEELERSLRTEFENYLKGVLAGIKQDVTDFQKNFEAEFEKHRAQLDESIRDLSLRFEKLPELDRAFSESVTEHLRLARDEGATITANAIGAAEQLKEENASATMSYDVLRDAIKEITGQTSQSAILKSLVEQAGSFAPRGAFFIVKNDHFVGWKSFGKEAQADEQTVQETRFSTSEETVLAAAVRSLQITESGFGSHAADVKFLEPLGFGRPDRMYAIPLVARGRGVAVMYADYGTLGVNLNTDALETLVRVAGLTVELLAASNEVRSQQDAAPATHDVSAMPQAVPGMETEHQVEQTDTEEYSGEVTYKDEAKPEAAAEHHAFEEPANNTEVEEVTYFEPVAPVEESPVRDHAFAPQDEPVWKLPEAEVPQPVIDRETSVEPEPVTMAQSVIEPAATPAEPRPRLGDRMVDLPIDVSEDERRDHSDARRFARLLVSEIKLYNQQKVAEGREANDLYDRLREAVDRSREMYEKRVKPHVAAKFDYFHYELVNGLAEGSEERLGESYAAPTAV